MRHMTKKIFSVFVLMIFMLSIVPLAFAEENTGFDGAETFENEADGVPPPPLPPEESAEKKPMKNLKEARHRLAKAAENRKERLAEARKHVVRAKDRLQNVRAKYSEAKDTYQRHRATLADLKDSANCSDDGEECKSKKFDLKKGVKQHLLKTSDLIQRSLHKLEDRITKAKTLSEEEKESALEKIAELDETLIAQKEEVEALAENATNEELRNAIKDLKETWKEVRKEQKHIVASLMNTRLNNLVDKHQEYANGMELRLEALAEDGASDAELERLRTLLAEFNEIVAQLEQDQEKADATWERVKAGDEDIDVWRKAHENVRKDVREAKKVLREFISVYKEVKQGEETTSKE